MKFRGGRHDRDRGAGPRRADHRCRILGQPPRANPSACSYATSKACAASTCAAFRQSPANCSRPTKALRWQSTNCRHSSRQSPRRCVRRANWLYQRRGDAMSALDLDIIAQIAHGRFGTLDTACPACGPQKRRPISQRKPVLRIWRHDQHFASYHCARCGIKVMPATARHRASIRQQSNAPGPRPSNATASPRPSGYQRHNGFGRVAGRYRHDRRTLLARRSRL